MRLETNEPVAGEPEDGWQTAAPLVDTQVLTLVLCRFTGEKIAVNMPCPSLLEHPKVDCRAVYFQADAMPYGVLAGGEFPETQEELRAPWPMGEAIGTTH